MVVIQRVKHPFRDQAEIRLALWLKTREQRAESRERRPVCTFELLFGGSLHEEGHATQKVHLGDEPVLVKIEHVKQEPVGRYRRHTNGEESIRDEECGWWWRWRRRRGMKLLPCHVGLTS